MTWPARAITGYSIYDDFIQPEDLLLKVEYLKKGLFSQAEWYASPF